jgi:WD40 repeat protein
LKNNDIGISSLTLASNEIQPKLLYTSGFHYGGITDMDISLQRPLLVTCSQTDSSIRIWNYSSMKNELYFKFFQSEKENESESTRALLSVAFHPSGYYLAAGFVDKVRIFHILYDDLRFFKEVNIKSATVLKFSKGGHLLAIGAGKIVYIYTAYSLELVYKLNNHV